MKARDSIRPLLRFPEVGGAKIASVPATPFTWKGYVGRNFETELTFQQSLRKQERPGELGRLLRAATVAVLVWDREA